MTHISSGPIATTKPMCWKRGLLVDKKALIQTQLRGLPTPSKPCRENTRTCWRMAASQRRHPNYPPSSLLLLLCLSTILKTKKNLQTHNKRADWELRPSQTTSQKYSYQTAQSSDACVKTQMKLQTSEDSTTKQPNLRQLWNLHFHRS